MNSFRIRSNMTSALAYKNLSKTQHGLQTTLERLSSGLRINKASDDTAGSAISTRMSNQIRGMKQANKNVQNANNLIQMAEGGLSDISDMLRRMRGLAVQASTDTLTDTDRASVNLEFQAFKDEISRISLSTEYNEMNVLDGTHQSEEGKGTWRLQIGADNDANSRIELQIMDATAKGLDLVKAQSNSTNGMLSQAPISSTNANSTSGSNLTLGRPAMTNSNEGNNPSRSSEAVDGNPGSRWSSNRNDPGPDINNPHYLIVDLEEVQSIGQIKLNIAGGDNWNQTFSVLVSTDHEDWSIVASETDSTGTFIYDLPSPDVRYIKFESYYSEDAGQVNVYELEAYKDSSSTITPFSNLQNADLSGMDLSGANLKDANLQDANLQAVGDDLQWLADANLQGAIYDSTTRFPDGFDVGQSGAIKRPEASTSQIAHNANVLSVARIVISTLDDVIDQINQERSYLGSVQNKLQFTMSNLISQTQSIEAARSSIQDTDFAADAADLAKNQILAQSATAMLAQASAISQNILSLIAA